MRSFSLLWITVCVCMLSSYSAHAQLDEYCAFDLMRGSLFQRNAKVKLRQTTFDLTLHEYITNSGHSKFGQQPLSVMTIPVVVHIIHQNGNESISDDQVQRGIRDLNDAFANRQVYFNKEGVDLGIEFCLAKQDEAGNLTTGITRRLSALADVIIEDEDLNLKNLDRWDPTKYLNIWLVREITSNAVGRGVAGYAFFPSSHGEKEDGIVVEARWFGSTQDNSKIHIHEVGHYLGLYHTFEGSCTNDDCTLDGDMVCDTPPDAITRSIPCLSTVNSCSTDENDKSVNNPFRSKSLGGLGDQNDLFIDYMDYGDQRCQTLFTLGQKTRMVFALSEVRRSLLQSKGCLSPCVNPVTASFAKDAKQVIIGANINFKNTSIGATQFEWRIDNILLSTSTDFSTNVLTKGKHIISLTASNSSQGCVDRFDDTITVVCKVQATFSINKYLFDPNEDIILINTSTGGDLFQWLIDGKLFATTRDLTLRIPNSNIGGHEIKLVTSSDGCLDTSSSVYIRVGSCKNGKEGDKWVFGFRTGLDFSSGQPKSISSSVQSNEGTASISDANGNLLMYTDGSSIWNAQDRVMPNGDGLWGSILSAQSAIIVPKPGSTTLFYVITVPNWTDQTLNLCYSVVDMTLDGGLGAVTSEKNIILRTNCSERVTAAYHNNCKDIWILSHEMNNNRYVAALLTENGFSSQHVTSDIGSSSTGWNRYGFLRCSPNGRKICSTLGGSDTDPTVELFDFDRTTGQLSNAITLCSNGELPYIYCSEFSPDNSKLYIAGLNNPGVYQYDLSVGSTANILASKVNIASGSETKDALLMGPDGKIYVVSERRPFLSVIESPNSRGTLSNFRLNAITLGNSSGIALPNFFPGFFQQFIQIDGPTSVCTNTGEQTYRLSKRTCVGNTYEWFVEGNAQMIRKSDEDITLSFPDVGAVRLIAKSSGECGIIFDTLPITVTPMPKLELGADTSLCNVTQIILDAGTGYDDYMWHDGGKNREFVATKPGKYWVTVTKGGCSASDSINITPGEKQSVSLGPDTLLCEGGTIVLSAGNGFRRYRWQDGSDLPTYTVFLPGKYWVTTIDECGNESFDTILVSTTQKYFSLQAEVAPKIIHVGDIAELLIYAKGWKPTVYSNSLSIQIRFNSDVLTRESVTIEQPSVTYEMGQTTKADGMEYVPLTIHTQPGTTLDDNPILRMKFTVSLTDTLRSSIEVLSALIGNNSEISPCSFRFDTVLVIPFIPQCGDSLLSSFMRYGKSGITLERIFPNPAATEICLLLKSIEPATIEICDVMGREVLKESIRADKNTQKLTFDIRNLAKGLYMIKGFTTNTEVHYTFIKQ